VCVALAYVGGIVDLQDLSVLDAGVHESGGDVHEQTQPRKTRPSLEEATQSLGLWLVVEADRESAPNSLRVPPSASARE
jgi:hypothetical protein